MEALNKYIADHLEESVFSSNPARRRQAFSRLHKLMEKPLLAKDASEKVKKYCECPKLHADFDYFAKNHPENDMRPILKKRMREISLSHQGK